MNTKRASIGCFPAGFVLLLLLSQPAAAQQSTAQQNWYETNSSQEEFSASYSIERGVRFLEDVARKWGEEQRCVTCHTNGYAMVALKASRPDSDGLEEIRTFAEEYLSEQVRVGESATGQEPVEGIVATTAMLMIGSVGRKPAEHPAIRSGLDYAWSRLSDQGVWDDWLQCNWPPFESDVCFGNALMLVALGKVREADNDEQNENSHWLLDADRRGAERLITGLRKQKLLGLHDKAMRLWAGNYWTDLVGETQKTQWLNQIQESQNADGGWSIHSLAAESWKHESGEAFPRTSDAYPTAFMTYVLSQVDAESSRQEVERGRGWLASQQRVSGRWFSHSPRRDNHHYITHAATAFAVMCLDPSE